jgi:hypothetical protein
MIALSQCSSFLEICGGSIMEGLTIFKMEKKKEPNLSLHSTVIKSFKTQ